MTGRSSLFPREPNLDQRSIVAPRVGETGKLETNGSPAAFATFVGKTIAVVAALKEEIDELRGNFPG